MNEPIAPVQQVKVDNRQNRLIGWLIAAVVVMCCGMLVLFGLIVSGPSQFPILIRSLWTVPTVTAPLSEEVTFNVNDCDATYTPPGLPTEYLDIAKSLETKGCYYAVPATPAITAEPTNAPVLNDENVFVFFGGHLAQAGNSSSGHEGIFAVHKSWLTLAGGYGLQGDLTALFCGNNGVNVPADAKCRLDAQAFATTWSTDVGVKYEFMNDGSVQFIKAGDRLYYFGWDAKVPPNQISNVFWTGNSFVICMNDSGPAGSFGGKGVGPCIEVTDWIPWDQAGTMPGFAPYLAAYEKLENIPTSQQLVEHGNPILLVSFRKDK